MKPGHYPNLPNDDYHSSEGYSSTTIKKFLEQTPHKILCEMTNKQPSNNKNFALGSAVHALLLEPENFDNDFAVAELWNLRTKAGKAAREAFEAENRGKTIIDPEQYAHARLMANAAQDRAGWVLENTINENSFYYIQELPSEKEVLCKVRPDAISKERCALVDIKTCESAALSDFQRDIIKYNYHLSAAMYFRGVNLCDDFIEKVNMQFSEFYWLCIEKKPPYQVAVYQASELMIAKGLQALNDAFSRLDNALNKNWPSYPRGLRVIDPPRWADNVKEV